MIIMTSNQKIFADEWLKYRNATNAYLIAFPQCTNRGTAGTEGHKLLRNPEIKAYVDERLKKLSENAGLTVQRVLEEEARISLSTLKDLFDGKSVRLPPHELSDDVARAIKGVEVKTKNVFHTNGDAEIITTYKYSFWSKGASLQRVEKYLGMSSEKIDITSGGEKINTDEEVLRRFAFLLRNKEEEIKHAG